MPFPSSSRAAISIERMSSREPASGSARRSAMPSASRASARAIWARTRRKRGSSRTHLIVTPIVAGEPTAARTPSRARRRSSRRCSLTPKTARMITSSVIACIEAWSRKGVASGQESISRSVAASITAS